MSRPEGSLRARTVAILDRYATGGRVTNNMALLLREWLGQPAPEGVEAVRARLRAMTCVQAGWAFGVPEDGRAQWLDLVAAAIGPEPVEVHAYDDDGTDPGNCRVCHFYHREPRGPHGEVPR